MNLLHTLSVILCLATLVGCKQAPSPSKAPSSPPPVAAKVEASAPAKTAPQPAAQPAEQLQSREVVFDPRSPPAGYVNCHNNHCHKMGGGVASYVQVMQEVGATKIVGVPASRPMPQPPVDVAAAPADAIRTASGLVSKVISPGDGNRRPGPDSVVSAHYTGWTTDGKAFDSSIVRGTPATFPLNRVFPGWTEGLMLMSVGETRRLWIPQELAFNGAPGRPAGTLVFDVELLEIR